MISNPINSTSYAINRYRDIPTMILTIVQEGIETTVPSETVYNQDRPGILRRQKVDNEQTTKTTNNRQTKNKWPRYCLRMI